MTSLTAWEREEREESALPMAVCVHACEIECWMLRNHYAMREEGGEEGGEEGWIGGGRREGEKGRRRGGGRRRLYTRRIIIVVREACSGSIDDVQGAFGPLKKKGCRRKGSRSWECTPATRERELVLTWCAGGTRDGWAGELLQHSSD